MARNSNKKEEKIIEKEAVINPEAPKKAESTTIKLKIEIGFSDKYTNAEYKAGDIISFEEKRADELLKDPRKLVSKVK